MHRNDDSDSSIVRRLLVGLVLVSVITASTVGTASGAAGTISVDTETTTTSYASDLQTGENRTYNGSADLRVTVKSDSNDTRVEFSRNASGVILSVNESGVNVAHNVSGNEDNWLNHTVSQSTLADTEHSINENVTMDATAINNSTSSTQENVTFNWYLEFGDATSVEYINDSEAGASSSLVTIKNESGRQVLGFEIGEADRSRLEATDRNITKNTTVILALGNQTVYDDFDAVASGASSGDKLSDLGLSRNAVLLTGSDGTTAAAPVYYKTVPDSVSSSDTYAVLKKVGGTWSLKTNPGSQFDSANTVSVTAVGNAGLLTFAQAYIMNKIPLSLGGGVGGLMMPLFVAGRTEPRAWFRGGEADQQARGGA